MPLGIRFDPRPASRMLAAAVPAPLREELDRRAACVHADMAAEIGGGAEVLERHMRSWVLCHEDTEGIRNVLQLAAKIRARFRAFVLVGIGGSDLAARTLHDALDHPDHNLLPRAARGGAPEMHFAGDTFDPRRLSALLAGLKGRGLLPRTAFNIVSKSGTTLETLVAAAAIKAELGAEWRRQVVITTGPGEKNPLYSQQQGARFLGSLPVPVGIGGRFSFASAGGLLPLAVAANEELETPERRLAEAMEGYQKAHEALLRSPRGAQNVAVQIARLLQLAEQYGRCTALVLYNFADQRMLGDWVTQLWSESLQERGGGLDIIVTRGSTGNHSILNGILRGPRNKLVLFVRWEDLDDDLTVPADAAALAPGLRPFAGAEFARLQHIAGEATRDDLTENGVPNALLTVGRRDARHLFALMRVLLDVVAIKGRLAGLHLGDSFALDYDRELTYRQDGVDGYKRKMLAKM